jgi:hypothetical protein
MTSKTCIAPVNFYRRTIQWHITLGRLLITEIVNEFHYRKDTTKMSKTCMNIIIAIEKKIPSAK